MQQDRLWRDWHQLHAREVIRCSRNDLLEQLKTAAMHHPRHKCLLLPTDLANRTLLNISQCTMMQEQQKNSMARLWTISLTYVHYSSPSDWCSPRKYLFLVPLTESYMVYFWEAYSIWLLIIHQLQAQSSAGVWQIRSNSISV